MEERIAYFAFAMSHGNVISVREWLVRLGCKITHETDEELHVEGLTGVVCGMMPTDPVSCAVQLGFALAGQFWPQVYPDLLPIVNKKWKVQNMLMKESDYKMSDLGDPIVEFEIMSKLFGNK